MSITQRSLAANNGALQQMFEEVVKTSPSWRPHCRRQVRLSQLQLQAAKAKERVSGNNPASFQEVADLDTLISNLDKRIGDLIVSQQSAMQVLPMIRIIQANNQN